MIVVLFTCLYLSTPTIMQSADAAVPPTYADTSLRSLISGCATVGEIGAQLNQSLANSSINIPSRTISAGNTTIITPGITHIPDPVTVTNAAALVDRFGKQAEYWRTVQPGGLFGYLLDFNPQNPQQRAEISAYYTAFKWKCVIGTAVCGCIIGYVLYRIIKKGAKDGHREAQREIDQEREARAAREAETRYSSLSA